MNSDNTVPMIVAVVVVVLSIALIASFNVHQDRMYRFECIEKVADAEISATEVRVMCGVAEL